MKAIPGARLSVFISSAQRKENDFDWESIRRRIKEYLLECSYLDPFIIEDEASTIPSSQFYQLQVHKADIVVLLVKGELRDGTATEYATAVKYKKPLLVYFLEDEETSLTVERLKRDIEANDVCTYRPVKDFQNIEEIVRDSIISDVIRKYQFGQYNMINEEKNESMILSNEKMENIKYSVPQKTTIDMFSSCYDFALDIMNIGYFEDNNDQEESLFHDFGKKLLEWFITGKKIDISNDVIKLIEKIEYLFDDTKWLLKRWDAIRYEIQDDVKKALNSEREALQLAKNAGVPTWIINDILIDCRNMEEQLSNIKNKVFVESRAQEEINQLDTIIYLPICDRYLKNAYDSVNNEEFKRKFASRNTTFIGSNIKYSINCIENYFFSAVIYGSYTHMSLARKEMSRILYRYAEMTEDEELLVEACKLMILYGNAKDFKQFVQANWGKMYACITLQADKLWELSCCVAGDRIVSMKCTVVDIFGMYFSDDIYDEVTVFLEKISDKIWWGNSQDYFECVLQNMPRLPHNKVVDMIVDIIKEERFNIGEKLAKILMRLDLNKIETPKQQILCNVLCKNVKKIVGSGGQPQFIASLVRKNKGIFSVLEDIPDNGLIGTQKLLYKINVGEENWKELLANQIDSAKGQFKQNNSEVKYTYFAEQPYLTIKKIVREHYEKDMNDLVVNEFFPLCIEVLSSKINVGDKEKCINCLCDVVIFGREYGIKIPQKIKDNIKKIDEANCSTNFNLTLHAKEIYLYRLLLLKIVVGVAGKEELFEWFIGYNKKSSMERVVLAECLEQYLCSGKVTREKDKVFVLSLILQCAEDDSFEVRKSAIGCLINMVNIHYGELVERKLYELALDSSHNVRNYLLCLCKQGKINDKGISKRIIDILKNDNNYFLKNYASE